MKKALLSMLFGVLIISSMLAQQRTISGRVSSAEEPDGLIGANILVKGTSIGVVTDLDGNYTVQVPAGATTLVFSYIGYLSTEEVIGTRAQINVTLNPDAQNLQEIVITAYGGTVDKGNFTGSAVSLKGDKIADRPINNVVNAIEGQAPGVITTSASGQPGATPAVRIRGVGSVNSSSSPLYVVDGVPYDGDLSNLNPSDIADMTILKDASSSALFGARAANGVIMITTKTGRKNEPTFNLKIQQGFSRRALPEYDRINAQQYYPVVWESLKNGRIGAGLSPQDAAQYASTNLINVLRYNNYNVPNDQIVGLDGTLNPNAVNNFEGLEWFDELQRTGDRKEYNMTYSGGSDKTDF
jgi:TonB-dependent SusC/RagA subfamily outer membrane receptor